ncbi:MAG: hypothetical protein OXR68_02520, partial [Alphaproteobacteria bacterium]|nr:hypothetical protein [Alphaproteobacteria bacterium]
DDDIDSSIESLNIVMKNIYDLNLEISAQETANVNGSNANDLRDRRQEQINILAKSFKIQVTENSNGAVRIITENGRQLVDVSTYSQLERITASPYDGIGVRRILSNGTLSNSVLEIDTSTLTEGSIKAMIDMRDTTIPAVLAELDNLTTTFKNEFNRLHSQGSSYPPVNSLVSGNTSGLGGVGSDLFTDLDANLASDTFHVSIVDSTGDPVYTTMVTGLAVTGTGPITIPGAGPFSLTDLETLINNNADVGNTALGGSLGAVATAGVDSNGQPIITMAAADSNLRIVLSNASGDALGILGMNNFFTGDDSDDIDVRSDIQSSPGLFAFGQMRTTDGGISSLDNANAIQLAAMSENTLSFTAAGGLPALTDSTTGYVNQILANFAVDMADADDRQSFAESMLFEMRESEASVSGVNIDEELAQMLIYQNAFQASARIISSVDELLQFLIQRVG